MSVNAAGGKKRGRALPGQGLRGAKGAPSRSRIDNNLLTRPGAALLADLDRTVAATTEVFPVPASHKRDLPYAVRDLSRLLTLERSELARSYWAAPRFLAAYLHYFLPWNLYRMAWLLPGLDLPLRPGARILDLGSGPLTLPLALWCARPDLRGLPLSFLCSDVAAKPMELGRDILRRLAGDDSPWRIVLRRAPLEKALALPGQGGEHENFDCIMAGNVLNELPPTRNASLEERLERLMKTAAGRIKPGGRLLLAEPGARLGGKLVALARKGALAHGLSPLAPCTHDGPCPMLASSRRDPSLPPPERRAPQSSQDRAGRSPGAAFTGWCHFFHPAGNASPALTDLTRQARLEKYDLAVSCLLLGKPASDRDDAPSPRQSLFPAEGRKDARSEDLDDLEALYAEIMAQDADDPARSKTAVGRPFRNPGRTGPAPDLSLRVISDLIRLPDETEPGRYACCERGLALLLDAARVPSGGFARVPDPEREKRDPKTGALILRRPDRHARRSARKRLPGESPASVTTKN